LDSNLNERRKCRINPAQATVDADRHATAEDAYTTKMSGNTEVSSLPKPIQDVVKAAWTNAYIAQENIGNSGAVAAQNANITVANFRLSKRDD